VGDRGSGGLFRADGAHRHSFNAYDFNVGESDETEDGTEIRLLKIALLRRTFGVNASLASTKMRRLPLSKPSGPLSD
jgi:hypothetical protein